MRIASTAAAAVLLLGAAGAAEKKPWKDQSVSVGDNKIHCIEAGAGNRGMILVPGWTMVAEVWREQIAYFAARGFRVVAFDPRSHGSTTRTEAGNTYHQHAADLHALLKTLGLEHPILVGWSSGVTTLLEYLASPETLQPEKLVLVDGAPRGLRGDDYPHGATLDQARQILLALQEDRARYADRFVRSMFKGRQPELIVKELVDGSLKTPTGTAAALMMDNLTGDRRPALPRIPSPTLVVVPDSNRLLGEYLSAKIPRSKLEVITGAGHAVFLDKPQAFNQALEAFVGEQ